MSSNSFLVGDDINLDNDIKNLATAAPGAYTITFTGTIAETQAPEAIDLPAGVTLTIDGGGFALDGQSSERGLFVYAGNVTIKDLTIENANAIGGGGSHGGGGGAGLGGGLFVAGTNAGLSSGGTVTLDNVSFQNDAATGGAGGSGGGFGGGGGGGMGGRGGHSQAAKGGGGGGIGDGTFSGPGAGGDTSGVKPGQPGLVAGAGHGGAGFGSGAGTGGTSGGGGGAAGVSNGGGGGGGVGGTSAASGTGGAGGFGGGGGGGGGGGLNAKQGGAGGFGGGGGGSGNSASAGTGGAGGFGGGGGDGGGNMGVGGFGGGNGAVGLFGGGGGLGAGGDIFVQQGGSLIVEGGSFTGGTATGGAKGGSGAGAGSGFGGGIFVQSNTGTQAISFAPPSGQTLTITAVITDEQGAASSGGAGAVIAAGGGTVILGVANTFTGGSTIQAGTTLELNASGAGGSGAIGFGAGLGTLAIESTAFTNGTTFGNTVNNFVAGDVVDMAGLTFKSGAKTSLSGSTLKVISNGVTNTVNLTASAPGFGVIKDAGTGSDVFVNTFTIASAADLTNALLAINVGGVDAFSGVGYTFDYVSSFAIGSMQTIDLGTGSSVDFLGGHATTGGGFEVAAGTLIAGASGALGSGAIKVDASGTLELNSFNQTIGDLLGTGSIDLGSANLTEGTSDATAFSGAISGTGGLIEQGGGTLTLSGTNSFSGGATIEAGSRLEIATGAAAGSGTISFDGAGALLWDDTTFSPSAIAGLAAGDAIDFTSIGTGDLAITNPSADNATINGVPVTGSFASLQAVANGGGAVVSAACYRSGTRILTPSGEMPIETLAIGDLVVTRSGEARPIKWIGRRSYAGRFIVGNREVLPIRFTANSLVDGIPSRDLDVSPKHAMLIDGVLVPAELLVNGVSIEQLEDVDNVEYFHLELASHNVILAEGAHSETFVDCDSRGMFHNAAEYAARYPDDPGQSWRFCAPRLDPASAALVAIRARLAVRAGLVEDFGLPEALQGHIDSCDRIRMRGWIHDHTHPGRRVRLEIRLDGEPAGHVVANNYRSDLDKVCHLGDGRYGFDFTHPMHLNPLSSHIIELLRAVDGTPIPGSPVHIPAASNFDAGCRAGVAQLLRDTVDTATKATDLDDVVGYLMTQADALLAARARLETGARADIRDLHDRWGGLVPTAAVRRAAPELRPRALFVDELFPVAGESGGANAALDHMRALQRLGFEVSFVASHDLGDCRGRAAALDALGVRPLTAPWYGSVEEVLRRQAGRLDLVYLHRAGPATAYGRLVRQYCQRAHLVYGVADLHFLRVARQGVVEDRPEMIRESERLRAEELLAARLADVVITHSTVEAELLRTKLPGAVVAIVPWSVPPRASTIGFGERGGVVFVGHFAHEPNLDAVHWLAREIVPLVQRLDPAIAFQVVGNAMPDALRRLERPGLQMVGPVERLDGLLDAARLTVAPLRYGAGLKAKVIESLAAGVPCAGTSIAFEGMTLPAVLADCVADTPDALAGAIVRLYRDEAVHAAAAEAGRQHTLEHYGEARVDALMRQAVAPALRRWAGVTEVAA